MALEWSTVKREHVTRACELLVAGEHRPRAQAKGLFVVFGAQRLPAKHALRLAYCLANGLPLDGPVKFASGEGTVRFLKELGLAVERAARNSLSDQ